MSAEDVVDEVPELVEERHDLVVLEQAAREVAQQHRLGKSASGDAGREPEAGRVVVLAVARVEVEVDAPEALAPRTTS